MRYRYQKRRWRLLFTVIDFLGVTMFAMLRLTARLVWRSTKPNADPGAILVVQLDHLGDAILSTGMLRALKARFPTARLEVLCSSWTEELFATSPLVDKVHVARVNRFARDGRRRLWPLAMLAWGWRLRARHFDIGIDPRGEFPQAIILWLCGARRRLGWNCGGGGFLLTDSPQYVPARHEVASRQSLLDQLGIAPPEGNSAWPPAVPWLLDPSLAESTDANRASAGRLRVVLHLGAGMPARRWPARHWRELLGWLVVQHDAQITLVGSLLDRETASSILAGGSWHSVEDKAGTLTISGLAQCIAAADLFVGADSGPAHLAAAVNTPAVVLFSGTNHVQQWRPWGAHVRIVKQPTDCSPCHREICPFAHHACMHELRPRAVISAVEAALSHGCSRHARPGIFQPPMELASPS